jgi:hypothetical protein
MLKFNAWRVSNLIRFFGVERRPLENFLLQRIKGVRVRKYHRKDVFEWLLEESEAQGVLVAHHIMQTLSVRAIKTMFTFVSECDKGQVYSFLMARDIDDRTLGHALFGQTRFTVGALVTEGLSAAFFSCLKKIAGDPWCGELLQVKTKEQTLQQLIEDLSEANAGIKSGYAWSLSPEDAIPAASVVSVRPLRQLSTLQHVLEIDTGVPNPPSGPPGLRKKHVHRKRAQSDDVAQNNDGMRSLI